MAAPLREDVKMKYAVPLSPSKFQYHIQRRIQHWLGYIFRDLNPRSPDKNVQELLNDISKKTGGIVWARLSRRSRQVSITVKIELNYFYQLEDVEEAGKERKAA